MIQFSWFDTVLCYMWPSGLSTRLVCHKPMVRDSDVLNHIYHR